MKSNTLKLKLKDASETEGVCLVHVPIVVAVMDARRPKMHEKGRDIAIAPDPILVTCKQVLFKTLFWSRMTLLITVLIFNSPKAAPENKSRQACLQ